MSSLADHLPSWRPVLLVAEREVAAIFDSKIVHVCGIAFVVLASSIFMNEFFLTGLVDMSGFFELLPLLLPLFVPAISMRSWSEERRVRSIELLLTLPIRSVEAVLGKFLAGLVLLAVMLLGTLPIVVMLIVLGDPDLGRIAAGYLGSFLLGAMLLGLGSFVSALTADQIVSFVSAAVLSFLFVLAGNERVVPVLDGMAPSLSLGTLLHDWVSIAPHHAAFSRGIVSLSGLCYYLGVAAAFLWACALALDWNRE
ncbi:MAG: ABC transporter permease subunit [Acidobacteriota bacterium]